MKILPLSRFTLLTCLGLLASSVTFGQEYPNKPIRIITGGAGGGSDFTARQIAPAISGPLGQPVVVDNRGGILPSAEAVAKAAPDGYTLLVGGAALWQLPILQKTTPWDPMRDFSPITVTEKTPFVLAVHQSLPVKTVKEFIALAKAHPGQLNYSAGAVGGTTHLAMELFKYMAGVNIVNINFKGGSAGMTALITGEIQVTIIEIGQVTPHVKSGRLRALAVTDAQPSLLVPGLPTVSASGVPGYEWTGVTAVWAPGKTPAPIVARLNQEIVRALNRADIKERFLNNGTQVVGNTPDEFTALMKSDTAKITKVIQEANIKLN